MFGFLYYSTLIITHEMLYMFIQFMYRPYTYEFIY